MNINPREQIAPSPAAADSAPSGPRVFVRIVLLAVAARVILLVVGLTARGWDDPGGALRAMWVAWDAQHFLRVAEVGYRSAGGEDPLFIVFLPLYPATIRLAAFIFRDLLASALAVSVLATIGAAWFLYKLARLDAGHCEAWRAVVLLMAAPTAYFLALPYSEALFLFAVLASIYAARTERWRSAGIAGAAATATRLQGVVLVPTLAVEAWRSRNAEVTSRRRLAWTAVAGSGLLAYLAVNWIVFGDPLRFMTVQREHWHNQAAPPWDPLVDAVRGLVGGGLSFDLALIFWGRIAGTALTVGLLAAGARYLRLADQALGWLGLVLILSSSWLISMPRYLLGFYPLILVAASLTRWRPAFWTVVAASVALQGWFFYRYALGLWTF